MFPAIDAVIIVHVLQALVPTYAGIQPNQAPYSDALGIYYVYAFDVVYAPMHHPYHHWSMQSPT